MIKEIKVTSILNKMKHRDNWFLCDYSLNPYSGCAFNCIYCYIRGSKYGANMAKGLAVKINAPELLERQLARRAKKGEYGIIAISSATDAWQPVEKELKMTRKLLEIIYKYKFPIGISTRSTLILRDLDILKKIDREAILPKDLKNKLKYGATISTSISTLDEKTAKLFEPGNPPPVERLEILKKCHEKGFYVGINFMPLLPFISDTPEEIEKMIKAARDYKIDFIFISGLTLFGKGPADSKTLYYKVLEKHFPDLVQKYKSLYRIFFAPPPSCQEKIAKIAVNFAKKYRVQIGLTKDFDPLSK